MDQSHPGYANWRAGIKRWQDENRERCRAYARGYYHRTKVLLGEATLWTPSMDLELKFRLKKRQTYQQIADAMGFNRSAVAGRVHRLRKAGEIA